LSTKPFKDKTDKAQQPPPTPENPEKDADGGDMDVLIQVASFGAEQDALRALEALKSKGYANAYVTQDVISGIGTRYRVKVGKFKSLTEVRTTLEQLKKQEKFKDAYIFQADDVKKGNTP
jgi:cell division septation protein DedD